MKDKEDNLEIERKFLLKKVPEFNPKRVRKYLLHQIYIKKGGKKVRFRRTENYRKENDIVYHECIKTKLSPGVNREIERLIGRKEFNKMLKKNHRYILKTRYVYRSGGLKWEVDEFHGISLVMMEVELEDIKQKITIPKIIKKELIAEVTDIDGFSNYDLSLKKDY